MLNFDDRLLLHNTSGKDVMILDYQKKPYARVLADGTVEVNTNSEAYYLNEDRLGETAVPKDLPAEPQWKQVSRSSRFEWHDHRAHWMGKGDPPQPQGQGRRDQDLRLDGADRGRRPDGLDRGHADAGSRLERTRRAARRDLRLRRRW